MRFAYIWTSCTLTCDGILLIAEHEVTVYRNGRQEKELHLDTLLLKERMTFARDNAALDSFIAEVDTGGMNAGNFWGEEWRLHAGFDVSDLSLNSISYATEYSWNSYSPRSSGARGYGFSGAGLHIAPEPTGRYVITDTTVLRSQFSFQRRDFGSYYDHSGGSQQTGVRVLTVEFLENARIEAFFR